METLTLDLPTMYGDHHVIEVRRILLEIPGVDEVYASSSFRIVEVGYDLEKLNSNDITAKLEEAGYLGEITLPIETGASADLEDEDQPYFRHTAVYETTGKVVSFAQTVNYSGRPLWPCPGIGVIEVEEK